MHELRHYRWIEAAQVEPKFSVCTLFLLLYTSCLLFPPFLCFHHNILHSTIFLILHKGVPIVKSRKRKPWGRNQFPVGGMKTDEAAGLSFPPTLLLPTSTPRMTCHVHSPSLAALLSLPQEQAQAETLTDSKHFSFSSNKALYPDPLPPQEKGWTPSTGQQTHADRAFSVILASYSQCLAETAACTPMKPSLLD